MSHTIVSTYHFHYITFISHTCLSHAKHKHQHSTNKETPHEAYDGR